MMGNQDVTGASADADQALAVPVEPVSRLDPSGFDPSRDLQLVGAGCADCSDNLCTMNCSSAVLVSNKEWIAASIWTGVFPAKANAKQVAEYQARPFGLSHDELLSQVDSSTALLLENLIKGDWRMATENAVGLRFFLKHHRWPDLAELKANWPSRWRA